MILIHDTPELRFQYAITAHFLIPLADGGFDTNKRGDKVRVIAQSWFIPVGQTKKITKFFESEIFDKEKLTEPVIKTILDGWLKQIRDFDFTKV